MLEKTLSAIATAYLLFAALPNGAQAAKIYKTVKYYTISGTTAAQLDKALTRKGPYLKSTGQHHPGATTISFDPKLKLVRSGKYCKVDHVNVDVRAKVLLPRWQQRNKTKSVEMAVVWDTLSRDIKRHEESHIVIARAHASEIEHAIQALPYQKDCATLSRNIEKTTLEILKKHDEAQKQFDRVESINFEKRFYNLLIARVNQLQETKK